MFKLCLLLALFFLVAIIDAGIVRKPKTPLIISFDEIETDEDGGLFYSADIPSSAPLSVADDKDSLSGDTAALDALLTAISQSNATDDDKCLQYKSQINDVCLNKFIQRTRTKWSPSLDDSSLPLDLPSKNEDADTVTSTASSVANDGTTTAPSGNKRPSSLLISAQQLCCEYRQTYLRCLLSSINYVCPITEFNSLYKETLGLNELCSKFFSKSKKSCKKRYRTRLPSVLNATTSSPTIIQK